MSREPSRITTSSSARPLLAQIAVRFPFLADLAAAALLRLAPGMPLRRRVLKRAFSVVWSGINSGDFKFALLAYETDAEVVLIGASGVGLAESYSGSDGWTDFMDDIFENFGEPRFSVSRVRDGGSCVLAELAFTATGKVSGARVEEITTSVYSFSSRGKIARQEIFWHQGSWSAALEAAGMPE